MVQEKLYLRQIHCPHARTRNITKEIQLSLNTDSYMPIVWATTSDLDVSHEKLLSNYLHKTLLHVKTAPRM